ncbi:prolyl endopeptidase [Planctomycetota bacterium]|nr:prolyl endopeptidase [Planctomycetota bacterium]
MRTLRHTHCALIALGLTACSANPPASKTNPAEQPAKVIAPVAPPEPAFQSPPSRMVEVVDDYHGTKVSDPYRWLEDQDGVDVAAWVATQNEASRKVLDAVPERIAIRARLQELWNYARYDVPERAGSLWFWRKNDGLQNQSVLFTGDTPDAEGRVLLDPNTLSVDGTIAVTGIAVDQQGKQLAYATSTSGSDWREWHVLDIASGKVLPDILRWSKFAGAAWTHDGLGFFYQRYPVPKPGETFQQANRNPQYCYHSIGSDQAQDQVVYERPDNPEWGFQGEVTEDGKFLVLSLTQGTDHRNRIAFIELSQDSMVTQPLLMDQDASYDFVGNDGDTFYFRTNLDAPLGKLVAINRIAPQRAQWRTIIAEQKHELSAIHLVGNNLVASYLVDASSQVKLFALDGTDIGAIPLPQIGTVGVFTGHRSDSATYFGFTSFTQPGTIYQYDFATKQSVAIRKPKFGRKDDDLVTERVFLQSRDETRLCMFLVHKKNLVLNGSAPCFLYGYGGFDIAVTPSFSPANLVFIERGGIYAQAVLRGGSEYGERWHEAGMLGNKQNVFDDFIACADYLVRNDYTAKKRLAVGGRSNGGLLAAAVLTQHPEKFGAVIPEVGVLDMLRYHLFTIGWAWAPEYGRSDDPKQFEWLKKYSPLHTIKKGTIYPPTLILTGDHDDRVLPGHSYKFAATLQAAQAGPAPILLSIALKAGHGSGKPVHAQIDEAADRWAFLSKVLAK